MGRSGGGSRGGEEGGGQGVGGWWQEEVGWQWGRGDMGGWGWIVVVFCLVLPGT